MIPDPGTAHQVRYPSVSGLLTEGRSCFTALANGVKEDMDLFSWIFLLLFNGVMKLCSDFLDRNKSFSLNFVPFDK